MDAANYFFQANIYLVIFYLFYILLLKNETYFRLNRFYLLSAVFSAFVIPYLRLEWLTMDAAGQSLHLNIAVILSNAAPPQPVSFDWQKIVIPIYFAGTSFAAVLLAFKLWRMKHVLNNPVKGVAFSFFRHKRIDMQLQGYETINKHEEAHITQLHSLDVLLFEVAGVFAWFNPVIYLYKSSIKEVHEYLADEEAVKYEGDKRKYALLLLTTAMGGMPAISNPFVKESLTKKRIFMLQKERSGKRSLLRYSLFIPLFAGMVLLSSATINRDNAKPDFGITATKPEFPGGYAKFAKYLRSSTKYPLLAAKNNIAGKVAMSFIVDQTGQLTQVKVVKGLGYGLDEEAIRLLSNSPKWRPGVINGQPVRFAFDININFVPEL